MKKFEKMLSLDSALTIFDASAALSTAARLNAGSLLAEVVRKELKKDDDDDDDTESDQMGNASPPSLSTRRLPIAITDQRVFTFGGVQYPTVQHAFQSQKLPEEEREEAADLSLAQVIKRGREADLDIDAWDAKKNKLMLDLIIFQASQNEEMRDTLIKYRWEEVTVTDLSDKYWPATLPGIYQEAGHILHRAMPKRKYEGGADFAKLEEDKESEELEGDKESDEDSENDAEYRFWAKMARKAA